MLKIQSENQCILIRLFNEFIFIVASRYICSYYYHLSSSFVNVFPLSLFLFIYFLFVFKFFLVLFSNKFGRYLHIYPVTSTFSSL